MRKGQKGLTGEANPIYKHGASRTRLYSIWKGMRKRCFNKNTSRYKWYGEKGITIAEEWSDFTVFRDWSLENGYTDELTIDRIDSDNNYSPDNCRWITIQEQIRSKKGNVYITIGDETLILEDWCVRLNITRSTVYHRCERKNISKEDCIKNIYQTKKVA